MKHKIVPPYVVSISSSESAALRSRENSSNTYRLSRRFPRFDRVEIVESRSRDRDSQPPFSLIPHSCLFVSRIYPRPNRQEAATGSSCSCCSFPGLPGFRQQMQSLPAPVKRRVKALKQLQLVTTNIEAKFYEEVHALECEYYKMCAPLYQKRNDIISGTYEPTDEQCVWDSDDEEETLTNYMKEKAKIEDTVEIKDEATENEDDIKGIPDFWLTILKNVSSLSEMVQEHDEPILKHLHDIKVKFLPSNPMGFILEFYFTPNEYFSNSVLTKEYIMKCTPEKNDPFSFEGPEIYKCKGCVIDWKKGKNVTIKTIKKNQKHKSRGSMRTVTKTVQNDSFFNFFSPPIVPEDSEADMDDETQALLTSDFELGHYIRERIVPRAVLYYTGEGLEDEDEDYEDDEEGDDDDDDDEDEEEEASSPANAPAGGKQGDDPNECKQQ